MANTIEVVLKEPLENFKKPDGSLVKIGDEVEVAAGYGRYLIKEGKAINAKNTAAVKALRASMDRLENSDLLRRQAAEVLAQRMKGLTLTFVRQADGNTGRLFGSVRPSDVAKEINASVPGAFIDGKQIKPTEAFTSLARGESVRVQLHPQVSATVTVNIARTQDEADELIGNYEFVKFEDESHRTLAGATVVLIRPEQPELGGMFDGDFDIARLFADERETANDIKKAVAAVLEKAGVQTRDIGLSYMLMASQREGIFEGQQYDHSGLVKFTIIRAATKTRAESLLKESRDLRAAALEHDNI